ncbi:uncharacterized protein LOC123555013 isoform X2 [Mercenaria mercenaria]|uniref:uncharacterized protein LOC123555013 isoform X2 n=1 Tax=Mercenaria mercenaria TaxID=6596 RepID=UPI00234F99B2|nr:uncharacterized protein LOC123555013 isoform X2 [Mercenaria mercenaria]
MAEDYHLEKFPPIRPKPETISSVQIVASLPGSSLVTSASLCVAPTTVTSNTMSVASSVSSVVTVTRGSAALPLSMVQSQVPIMVVNPMQHKKSNAVPITMTTQYVQACSSLNTTTTSITSTNTNAPENTPVQDISQNASLVLGNPFPVHSSSTNVMPVSLLPNQVFQTNQFPSNMVIAPFVQNGVLQGNIIQGNFAQQSLGVPGGILQISPHQFGFQNSPQYSLTLPTQNPQVPISNTSNSSGKLGNETPTFSEKSVREKSVPKTATSSPPFQFVIEPDPEFNEKVKCARIEKKGHIEDKNVPSTSDTTVKSKSEARKSSTESGEQEEITEIEFLPKIEYCYSMKKLSLRQMMELLDKGQNVMLFVKPGSKDYYRAKVLCEAVVKYNVTGINTNIKDDFYTSLISPYISLTEAMLLKKDIKTSLNTIEEDLKTNTAESSCETEEVGQKMQLKNPTEQNSETGNEAALSILKWKTEKLESINPKMYQKYCVTNKDESPSLVSPETDGNKTSEDVEFIREEQANKTKSVAIKSKTKVDDTVDKLTKLEEKEKKLEYVKEALKSHPEILKETLSKQAVVFPENLDELFNKVINKVHTSMEKKIEAGKADMINKKSYERIESEAEIGTSERKQIDVEIAAIPNRNRKGTCEAQQRESEAESIRREYNTKVAKQNESETRLLREDYRRKVAKQSGSEAELLRKEYRKKTVEQRASEAELIRNMYTAQNNNPKQSKDLVLKNLVKIAPKPTEPVNEAELIRKAFTLSKFNITENDISCSSPKDQDKTVINIGADEDVIEILDDAVETDEQTLEIRLPDRFHLSKWRWTTLAGTQKFSVEESDEILKICYLCGLEFLDASTTWKHILNEHAKISAGTLFPTSFFCSHCYKTNTSMKISRQHELDIHLCDFPCYFCGLSIDDRWDMLSHIACVHSLLYTCTCCQGQFLGKSEFQKHCSTEKHMQATITDESQIHFVVNFMCLFCNVKFCTKQNLISHLNSLHIDTPIPNSGESVCSSCRHSFLDAQALFFHRNPDARKPEKLRQLSSSSLNALAVQGTMHKEKAEAYRDKKKRMKCFQKGAHNTNSNRFSKVEECMRTNMDVDEFGYREIKIGSKQYKYPLEELLEYCEFGKNFPKEFSTVVMDDLIKLLIKVFPTLQVNRATLDLQDLLVALSRSQKFTEILQKYHLKPLPWNGKIQACVKMFINKVRAGCYRYPDVVPMNALLVSLQKSLNYLDHRRDSVVQKLRAKILGTAGSSKPQIVQGGQSIRNVTTAVNPVDTFVQSTISFLSTVNSNVQTVPKTTDSFHAVSSNVQVVPITISDLPTTNPNVQVDPKSLSNVPDPKAVPSLPAVIPSIKAGQSSVSNLPSVDPNAEDGTSAIGNLPSIDPDAQVVHNMKFKSIWQEFDAQESVKDPKSTSSKKTKRSEPVPIAPKGCFSFVLIQKKEEVKDNNRSARALRAVKLKIKKKVELMNQMKKQSNVEIAGKCKQQAIKTVREIIAKKRGEAFCDEKEALTELHPKKTPEAQSEKIEITRKRSRKNVKHENAFNKNLRKRTASVKYTFEDILDESDEETTPFPSDNSDTEDEWKPSKVESEEESSESESDGNDNCADEDLDSQSDDEFENESVTDKIKFTENENEKTCFRKVDKSLYISNTNSGSQKSSPVIVLDKNNLSQKSDNPGVSLSKTENSDKSVVSRKLSEDTEENLVNVDMNTGSKEQLKVSDPPNITQNLQKRNASDLVKEFVPAKVVRIAHSADSLPSCLRRMPWLNKHVKCSVVKIERSHKADCLGLELIAAREDYTNRKLTRTFVKQICQEESIEIKHVVHDSDKDLFSNKEEMIVKNAENTFGNVNAALPPKRGRGRPKKNTHKDQLESIGEEKGDSLPKKRGRPKKNVDETKTNFHSGIALNDSDTGEEIPPRKRGRPRKNIGDSVTDSDCSNILDDVDTVEDISVNNIPALENHLQGEIGQQRTNEKVMRERQPVADIYQKEECSKSQLNEKKICVGDFVMKEDTLNETTKKEDTSDKAVNGSINSNNISTFIVSDHSESKVENITQRKRGRPKKDEILMKQRHKVECSYSQFRTKEHENNGDPAEIKNGMQELRNSPTYEKIDEVNVDTSNSELVERKMLRPRKNCNYIEHDSSNDSSSEGEDSSDPLNFCGLVDSNVTPKPDLINVTNSKDIYLPVECNDNSGEINKADFVSTETKRMLSKMFMESGSRVKEEKVDEEHLYSEIQEKAGDDGVDISADKTDRENEIPMEVIKPSVRIKEEKEDPEYSKAEACVNQTGHISEGNSISEVVNSASQLLQTPNQSNQILRQLADLAKKNQNVDTASASDRLPTLIHMWSQLSTGFQQSEALATSATSSSVTSTSASTATQLMNPIPATFGTEKKAKNTGISNPVSVKGSIKKEVTPPPSKQQQNAQVIRHPVYFYPGSNSATPCTSQGLQLPVSQQNSSSSCLTLVPVSGTNKFILVNVPTQQSCGIIPNSQAQQTQVRNQTQQMQQTQMMQQPQMIQRTQVIQQTQMIPQPQMIQQTQMIQPHMIQQPQMVQQTHMMQPQMIQQPQMVQQTQMIQQPQMMQQPQMIQHIPQFGQLQLTNTPTTKGGQEQISRALQSNQQQTMVSNAKSDPQGGKSQSDQIENVTIKKEVNTDEQSTSEVQSSGDLNQIKVSGTQAGVPVQQNLTQNSVIQQGPVPLMQPMGQMQGLLSNQLQVVQPGQVQFPGIQTVPGLLPNQFQGANQSSQIIQGLQFCQTGVQQLGQLPVGNVDQNQTQQTVPVIGSQGSTQTLMVNQQTPLAPGQLIYVPSSSQTGASSGQTGQFVNVGQAVNTSSHTGQSGNNSERTGVNIAPNVLNAEQASMVLQTRHILNATGNNSVQTGSVQIGSNVVQGLQVVNPVQGISNMVQTLQGQVMVQAGQAVGSTPQNQINKETATHNTKPNQDNGMSEMFALADSLSKKRSVSPAEQYKCGDCNITYTTQDDLNNHRISKLHFKAARTCNRCSLSFEDLRAFTEHYKMHVEELFGRFRCTCGQQFDDKFSLYLHFTKWHCRGFRCKLCNKSYSRKQTVFNHIIVDHGYVPDKKEEYVGIYYHCKVCEKPFLNKRSLKSHLMQEHFGGHLCEICGSAFGNAVNMEMHYLNKHQKQWVCNICKMVCNCPRDVASHISNVHKCSRVNMYTVLNKCDGCDKHFRAGDEMAFFHRKYEHANRTVVYKKKSLA